MAQTKRKQAVVNKPKRRQLENGVVKHSKKAEARAGRATFWQRELDALESKKFKTIDDAIYAMIDQVMKRINNKSTSETELRDFLFNMFDTDPVLKDEMGRILGIK